MTSIEKKPPLLSLFFAFQIIGGHIGFPILLICLYALKKQTAPHPLFVNVCVMWILSSITFCLLLYTGFDVGPEPPFGICFAQASLVFAMPIMAAATLWALIFHLWWCMRQAVSHASTMTRRSTRMYILLLLPYAIGVPFIIFPMVVGSRRPELISRAQTDFGFHCSIRFHPIRVTVAASLVVICIAVLVWLGLVCWFVYGNYLKVRQYRVHGWAPLELIVRIGVFCAYLLLGIIASLIAIRFPNNRFRILFQASLPTAAFLVFGTRPALYKTDNPKSTKSQSDSVEIASVSTNTLVSSSSTKSGSKRMKQTTTMGSNSNDFAHTRLSSANNSITMYSNSRTGSFTKRESVMSPLSSSIPPTPPPK